jgi:hypothetical protein
MKRSMEYLTADCCWLPRLPQRRHKPIGVMAIMTCGRAAIAARPMMGDAQYGSGGGDQYGYGPDYSYAVRRQTGISY